MTGVFEPFEASVRLTSDFSIMAVALSDELPNP